MTKLLIRFKKWLVALYFQVAVWIEQLNEFIEDLKDLS